MRLRFLKGQEGYIGIGVMTLVVQILIAVFIGGAFVFKVYWSSIKSFFKRWK